MGVDDCLMADANRVIKYLTDDLWHSRTVARGYGSVGNHSNSRGGHALRLLEVDELRVLPGSCLICCCISSQALLKLPKEL
eukprot:2063258-Pleurochrysis_carterae.AAC.1